MVEYVENRHKLYEKDFEMTNMESSTSICLFGAYPVRVKGKPFYLGISGSTERLFQYLLLAHGSESRREYLADLFWRGSSPAKQRSALNSAIWRIKRKLTQIDGVELVCQGQTIFLRLAEDVKVDANILSNIVHANSLDEPMDELLAERLFKILDECKAPFMDGVDADWVLTERERLFNIQVRGMNILMHWLGQQHRYEDALEIGRGLLEADPAREAAQCEVMLLYVLNGQRAQAMRQYQDFRSWLRSELSIEPMPETKVLYDYIRMGIDNGNSRRPVDSKQPRTSENNKPSFSKLLSAIDRSRQELHEVLSSQLL
jgi:DNA-binding SARP family transcriptional activator